MYQILVEVFCPIVGQTFDFRVSVGLTVKKFLEIIVKDIAFLCTDTSIIQYSNNMVLFSSIGALPKEKTLAEMAIQSGDKLMLL